MRTTADLALTCEPEHGCITCGDEAVPLRVLRVDDARGLALCEDASGKRTAIEIALIDPVGPGDGLLAHAGTAIAAIEPGAMAFEPGAAA